MPFYTNWLRGVLDGTFSTDWDNDTVKVALFAHSASTFVPNSSGWTYHSQVGTGEITGAGYTASGQTLTGLTIALNPIASGSILTLDASNPSWTSSTITARYAVVYKWTGNGATSPLICWVDFGSNQSSSSGTFEIQWNASGIGGISSLHV